MKVFKKFLHSLATAESGSQLKSRCMDRAGEALGADIHALYLFDSQNRVSEEIYLRGIREAFIFEYEALRREGEPGYARMMRTKKPITDSTAYPGSSWKSSELCRLNHKYRMKHYLCTPILGPHGIVGMLNLGRNNEAAPFDRGSAALAMAVSRALGRRLRTLSRCQSSKDHPAQAALERAGCLRAERAVLRAELGHWEVQDRALPVEEAYALWQDLAANRSTPFDFFDRGPTRYVLLPLGREVSEARAPALTTREREVVRLAAAGEANKAIAYELGLSLSTVASHLAAAIKKLGLNSRVRLVEEIGGMDGL